MSQQTNKHTNKDNKKHLKQNIMKTEHMQEAIQIITRSGNIKVSFNVPVKDNYANVYDILIHNSNASVINELVAAGFSLSMNDKGLSVTKY